MLGNKLVTEWVEWRECGRRSELARELEGWKVWLLWTSLPRPRQPSDKWRLEWRLLGRLYCTSLGLRVTVRTHLPVLSTVPRLDGPFSLFRLIPSRPGGKPSGPGKPSGDQPTVKARLLRLFFRPLKNSSYVWAARDGDLL